MAEPPAVDASPLILLGRAGLLDLLKLVGDEVIVPRAVVTEIERGPATDAAIRALDEFDWLRIADIGPIPAAVTACNLDAGETAVLTWAHAHGGCEALLDDLAARRCATALGIPFRGTLGLVLIAKQRGVINAARPVVDQLRLVGMRLSDAVRDRALALIGE